MLALVCALSAPLWCGSSSDNRKVTGTWEGESICTVPNSPCHDEHVVYEISEDKKTAGKLETAAYKIVNGEKQYMGTLSCEYLPTNSELRCHYKEDDLWKFEVSGDSMKGTLVINGDKLYRRVNLKRK